MRLMCVNNLSREQGYTAPLTPGKIYESVERNVEYHLNGTLDLYIWEDDANYYITNDTGFRSCELIENFQPLQDWREQQLNKIL